MRLASTLKRFAAAAALVATLPASAGVIDFDGTGAPALFSDTVALSDHYAALGVMFSGASGLGGSILNHAGEFGFPARSGTDFLAFNIDAGNGPDERIVFAAAQDVVSIHSATYEEGTFTMTAFDGGGNVLGAASFVASRDWQEMTLSFAGIRSVAVASTTFTWALDDLSFAAAAAPVPEPAGLALLGAGLAGLMASRRRRPQKA